MSANIETCNVPGCEEPIRADGEFCPGHARLVYEFRMWLGGLGQAFGHGHIADDMAELVATVTARRQHTE